MNDLQLPDEVRPLWIEGVFRSEFERDTLPLLFASERIYGEYYDALIHKNPHVSVALEQIRERNTQAREQRAAGLWQDCVESLIHCVHLRRCVFEETDYQFTAAQKHCVLALLNLATFFLQECGELGARGGAKADALLMRSFDLFKRAEEVVSDVKKRTDRLFLRAAVQNNFASYFVRRRKCKAAAQRLLLALRAWTSLNIRTFDLYFAVQKGGGELWSNRFSDALKLLKEATAFAPPLEEDGAAAPQPPADADTDAPVRFGIGVLGCAVGITEVSCIALHYNIAVALIGLRRYRDAAPWCAKAMELAAAQQQFLTPQSPIVRTIHRAQAFCERMAVNTRFVDYRMKHSDFIAKGYGDMQNAVSKSEGAVAFEQRRRALVKAAREQEQAQQAEGGEDNNNRPATTATRPPQKPQTSQSRSAGRRPASQPATAEALRTYMKGLSYRQLVEEFGFDDKRSRPASKRRSERGSSPAANKNDTATAEEEQRDTTNEPADTPQENAAPAESQPAEPTDASAPADDPPAETEPTDQCEEEDAPKRADDGEQPANTLLDHRGATIALVTSDGRKLVARGDTIAVDSGDADSAFFVAYGDDGTTQLRAHSNTGPYVAAAADDPSTTVVCRSSPPEASWRGVKRNEDSWVLVWTGGDRYLALGDGADVVVSASESAAVQLRLLASSESAAADTQPNDGATTTDGAKADPDVVEPATGDEFEKDSAASHASASPRESQAPPQQEQPTEAQPDKTQQPEPADDFEADSSVGSPHTSARDDKAGTTTQEAAPAADAEAKPAEPQTDDFEADSSMGSPPTSSREPQPATAASDADRDKKDAANDDDSVASPSTSARDPAPEAAPAQEPTNDAAPAPETSKQDDDSVASPPTSPREPGEGPKDEAPESTPAPATESSPAKADDDSVGSPPTSAREQEPTAETDDKPAAPAQEPAPAADPVPSGAPGAEAEADDGFESDSDADSPRKGPDSPGSARSATAGEATPKSSEVAAAENDNNPPPPSDAAPASNRMEPAPDTATTGDTTVEDTSTRNGTPTPPTSTTGSPGPASKAASPAPDAPEEADAPSQAEAEPAPMNATVTSAGNTTAYDDDFEEGSPAPSPAKAASPAKSSGNPDASYDDDFEDD